MGYFRENIEKTEGYDPGFQPFDSLDKAQDRSAQGKPEQADIIKLNTNSGKSLIV